MTEQEQKIIKKFVVKRVNKILLANTFADDKINPYAKLSDLTIFGDADIKLIKEDIATKFDLNITQDIADLPVVNLYKMVFLHVCNSPNLVAKIIKTPPKACPTVKTETLPPQPEPNKATNDSEQNQLNSHQVYAIVLSAMGSIMNRRILPEERIKKIKKEFAQNSDDDFDQVLMAKLQADLQTPIQIVTDTQSNPKMGAYSIANQTMDALINYGKAMPPEVEFAGMNPLWIPLYKSMTFDTVVKILLSDFGIWTSTKTISKIKSFENFDKYVTTLLIKNKVNSIVFDHDESVLHQSLSNTVISAQDAKSITQNVQRVFNITVDYDISGTKLGQLYKYIYKKTNASKELRYSLFGKTYQEPQQFELKTTPEELQEIQRTLFGKTYKPSEQNNMITRDEVFAGIIHRINCAVSLGYSVVGRTNICDLKESVRRNPKKRNDLEAIFSDIESMGVKVDISSNPELRIRDMCDAIHNILIERGASVSTRVAREDMDPIWGALNPTIVFVKLKTVLEYDMGIRISIDKLMNCKTYNDYEKLIFATQLKKASMQSK